MSYIINWEENGVYCKFSGAVSGNELIQCNGDLYGDARFDDVKYELFDMLDVTELTIKPIDVKKVAGCDRAASRRIRPNVKCALVAIDEHAHILSKVYQSEISESSWEGRDFTTIKDAREWLS